MIRFAMWIAGGVLVVSALLLGACGGSGGGGIPYIPITLVNVQTFQSASVAIGQPDLTSRSFNQGGAVGANTLHEVYGNPVVHNKKLIVPDPGNNRVLIFDSMPASNNAVADLVLGQPDFLTSANTDTAQGMSNPATVKVYGGKLFVADWSNSRVLIWNTIPTTNGEAADVVVGQADFGTGGAACTAEGMNSAASLFVVSGKLIVADHDNNRVLIWNTIPTTNGEPADIVLGQQSFTNCAANDTNDDGTGDGPTASTLSQPYDVWSNGTRLLVADSSNNRILIWNTFPATNFEPADMVIGQPDMISNTFGVGAGRLHTPRYLDSNGRQLVASDSQNNRVLLWDRIPTTDGKAANVVLGQSTFTNNTQNDDDQNGVDDLAATGRTLNYPAGVKIVGKKLIVGDEFNYRYLIYE